MKPANKYKFLKTYKNVHEPKKSLRQYLEVMKHLNDLNTTSYQIANITEIPRGRIKAWKNGATPDYIKALKKALDKKWIDLDYDEKNFRLLNKLASWVFSGGSITREYYQPVFSIETKKQQKEIKQILSELGLKHRLVHHREKERATEARLKQNSSILGRILYSMGAPIGKKNQEKEITLPSYLENPLCPRKVKKDFVDIYLMNRGTYDKQRNILRFREERNKKYLKQLKNLLTTTLKKPVRLSDKNIYIKNYK